LNVVRPTVTVAGSARPGVWSGVGDVAAPPPRVHATARHASASARPRVRTLKASSTPV